jgi:predicted AAA+ superfamily ATPase
MENFIGRTAEIKILTDVLDSRQAALIAVYGRRRVGKTYLIRSVYEKQLVFELTGIHGVSDVRQLENFMEAIQTAFHLNPALPIAPPQHWLQAFRYLIHLLEANPSDAKRVLFLDEFPWLDHKKSDFLASFDHFWNHWASKQRNLILVICGSSASWMIQNIVRNKGGLHNRITQKIRLQPFTLYETQLFLQSNRVNLSQYDILQLYMVTGGIPHYLNNIQAGESASQAIDRLCFAKDGWLLKEFYDLYPALFGKADKHIAIIRCLSHKLSGLTRTEIMESCQFKSGGTLSKVLEALEESSFITAYLPFGKSSKEAIFKLTDEYSLFYLKFMENSKSVGAGTWQSKMAAQSWKSWSGFAFENICLKHVPQIKKMLGISGVYTEQSAWRYLPKAGEMGVQIDLLLDRHDNCMNLVEIKFYNAVFTIDKAYAGNLMNKRQVFMEKTGTKKTIFMTLLTTFGAKTNEHYLQTIQNQLNMSALFEPL